ncbi:MAG: SHOCT domain-containing protein [Actinomycetota bacterium]
MTLLLDSMSRFADWGPHMDFDGGGWFWMGIMMIVGTLLVIAVIYIIIRALHQEGVLRAQPPAAGPTETPMDIAKRRLASGEITEEEFEKIKNRLGSP